MQVVLVMFRADGERRSFSLPREMTVIGRREDCDLRIPLGDVSRKHCRLVQEGGTLRLEDLGSSNGTYHNGQRVQEAIISPGDTIQIGPVVFVAQIDGMPPDDALQPLTMQAAAALDASTAGNEGLEAGELQEVEPEQLEELQDADQAQTVAGSDPYAAIGQDEGFDPLEVLQSEEEDGDELIDFDALQIDEEANDDDVQVPISFDDADDRPQNNA